MSVNRLGPATRLGVIADDYTGGSDVAAALRRAGLSVSLVLGVPNDLVMPDSDAVVVGLKTRTLPVAEAVGDSRAAARWLLDGGAHRLFVKYCSTFDSTPAGNIGPIVDAVLDAAGVGHTLICPATPEHGRTVYQGHLFVGDRLLSESSMATHPLTPMTDPDIVRVLGPQTPHAVGLVPEPVIRSGVPAVSARIAALAAGGVRHLVTDALDEDDLDVIAAASDDLRVLTGAAGLAGAVARRAAASAIEAGPATAPSGPAIVLAGSCSQQTLRQVALAAGAMPSLRLDPTVGDEADLARAASDFVDAHAGEPRVFVYSSASADERQRAQQVGMRIDGAGLERVLGRTARHAVDRGAHTVVVAGGETSGAVVLALGVRIVDVGPEAARGVPWCTTDDGLSLLLKSGNFGDDDLLERTSR